MGYTKPVEIVQNGCMTPPPSRQSSINVFTIDNKQESGFDFDHQLPKEPTPVLGSWADVWSSRQASEIILEDIDKEKESASMQLIDCIQEAEDEANNNKDELIAITTVNDDEEDEDDVSSVSTAPTSATIAARPLEEVFGAQEPQFATAPSSVTRPTINVPPTNVDVSYYPQQQEQQMMMGGDLHQRHVYSYNPYSNVNTRTDIHVCNCQSCVTQNRAAHAEIDRQRHAAVQQPNMMYNNSHVPADANVNVVMKQHNNTRASAPSAPVQQQRVVEAPMPLKASPLTPAQKVSGGGFQTHSAVPPPPNHLPRDAVDAAQQPSAKPAMSSPSHNMPQQQLSLFMPPPPPSLMTAEALERDGTANVDSLISYIMSRWYQKTVAVQDYFVAEADPCPNPELIPDFDAWCQACTDWWFRNFEFAQMKASSYAAMQGYSAPYGYNPAVPTANPVAQQGLANVW